MSDLLIEEFTWRQVRNSVRASNSRLADIIDELSPDDSYTFFKASYPYGSQILQKGELFLPKRDGSLVPLKSHEVPDNVRRKIDYNMSTNPVTLVLKNTLDLYVSQAHRIINYALIPPGSLFGLWRILDFAGPQGLSHAPISLWDMTAGARSMFMLPKISESYKYHKLEKKYKIKGGKPERLRDHWQVFKDIARHPSFENEWETELLYFSAKWFEKLHDPEWIDFKIFLLESSWKGGEFWRNQFTWGLTFSHIQNIRGIKPSPYIDDIVKHLFTIAVGGLPGFRPSIDDTVGPVKKLQGVFEEEYGAEYAPVILEPASFSVFDPNYRPTYYSFNYHTAIQLATKSSQRSSVVNDLYEIRSLLMIYLDALLNDNLNVSRTPLYEMAKIVEFDFFHCNPSTYSEIQPSSQAVIDDPSFELSCRGCSKQEMPKKPPFLNGCIRISGEGEA